jgi:hypothetical protein
MDSLKPVRKQFDRLLDLSNSEGPHTVGILVSYEVQPSTRHDHTVTQLCEISWDASSMVQPIPFWTNPEGKLLRKLMFEVEMTSEGGTPFRPLRWPKGWKPGCEC